MSKYAGEQILVVKRELFDELGAFQGVNGDTEHYLPTLLHPDHNFFMDRAVAEDDPTHKQLIPYCIFTCGDQVLRYTRGKSGGESRLHAKQSIGVGGHINPIDQRVDPLGVETYMAGVAREIEEELIINGSWEHKVIGILNDDSNEVGKVHLGVVHLVELSSTQVKANEDALADLEFVSEEELKQESERLETWSQFAIQLLV